MCMFELGKRINPYTGSNFDDFLAEAGILDKVTATAHMRWLALVYAPRWLAATLGSLFSEELRRQVRVPAAELRAGTPAAVGRAAGDVNGGRGDMGTRRGGTGAMG